MIGPGRFVSVVGPSGAGKDALLTAAKTECAGDAAIVFARRVVTRPTNTAEDHDSMDDAAFESAVRTGDFAFWWEAHGLKYGVPRAADDDIRAGRTVVCNMSRGVVSLVQARYARVASVLITAPEAVLVARLANRSRGSDGALEARIGRSRLYTDFAADYVIDNGGALDVAARRLIAILRQG